jgi:hypothetical protein
MTIYPNYTFSVPDKRLYTLYKGITVTPRLDTGLQCVFVRPSHLYTRRLLSLLRTTPLYTSSAATCYDAPSTEPRLLFAPHLRRRTSPRLHPALIGLPRHPAWTRRNVPAVWCF